MKFKSFIKEHLDKIIAVTAVIILYTIFLNSIGCPIKFTTGVSCMGCGMTRALWAAVRLHFTDAFYFHPLWPLVIVWIPVFIFRKKINKNAFKAFLTFTIAAFIVVYFIRMFDPHNHVVVFEPQNNIFSRLYNTLK